MNKYTTKSGQNLYDIALTLYGSIEGVFDLLVSNTNISFNTIFSKGTELNYHEDFVVNQDIVSWFDTNNVRVKNGQYNINETDIRSEIIDWIDNNNQQLMNKYTTGDLEIVYVDTLVAPPAFDWDDEDMPLTIAETQDGIISSTIINTSTMPFTPSTKWDVQNVGINSISTDAIQFAESISKIDFGKLSQEELEANFEILFSNGMITLPSSENERQLYYNAVSTPKILIKQNGKSITIGMQIPCNSFVAIDWGDDIVLGFYHYQKNTSNATHTYNDDDEHTITIYGDNKFTNLDLTKINGVYYALTEIYISNDFVSLYPNATELNKLFIKKTIQ